jgi:hypothetical protein
MASPLPDCAVIIDSQNFAAKRSKSCRIRQVLSAGLIMNIYLGNEKHLPQRPHLIIILTLF